MIEIPEKVFVVLAGYSYDGYEEEITRVFRNKEDAKEYASRFTEENGCYGYVKTILNLEVL